MEAMGVRKINMQDDQNLYKQAVQFYQAGNLADAEKNLRKILSSNPQQPLGLHLMGIIAFDVQRHDVAEELVRSAIAEQDNNPSFHFTLGRILNKREKKEEAIKSYRKAIALKPDFTDALNNLGTCLLSLGQGDEALEIFLRILKEDPRNFNALCNTASIFYSNKAYEKSLIYYQHAILIDPDRANLHYDIGRDLIALDRTKEGLSSFQKAIELQPDYIEALLAIGDIYRVWGEFDKALSIYARIKSIKPHEDAYANTVRIYLEQGRNTDAVMEAESAVKSLPESAQNFNNLARAYDKVMRYEEALDYYKRALTLSPQHADIHANIANTLKSLGRMGESLEALKKGLVMSPEKAWIYNNLLLTMVYASSVSPEDLAETARQFGQNIADALLRKSSYTHDKTPDRKLRIGFLSPDFRDHAVSYFLSPLAKTDKDKYELFAYSNVEKEDAKTEQIKKYFPHWRNIRYLSDDAAADLIEEDKIDILVDLAGHTAQNRLMVFARKPAPIQASWLGYPATTGMAAMDYRITDSYAEPNGMTEDLNTEKLWRLPDIFCVYTPHEYSPAVIDHPPFEDNGYITFGCFNNFTKVTDPVLESWARIMEQVPNSRLFLEIAGIENKKLGTEILERFEKHGLPIDRVVLEPYRRANQFVLYNKIDIALDPFPCNGGTTSMDTLWMGVPFVTLTGRHFVSRMGVTILTNAGLSELIAKDTDEYVSIAVDLAKNHEKLRKLRKGLREKLAASPVMDQEKFVRNMENAFRGMWKEWVSR